MLKRAILKWNSFLVTANIYFEHTEELLGMYSQKSRIAKHFEIFESVSIGLKQSSEKILKIQLLKPLIGTSAVTSIGHLIHEVPNIMEK